MSATNDKTNDNPIRDIRLGQVTSRWAEGSGISCVYQPTMPSTNDLAKDEAFGAATEHSLRLYLTDLQTKGRGRGGHTWTSPASGSSLLSSWSFEVEAAPQPWQTARTGLGLFRAALATWPTLEWSLKAPNDLYIGEQKVAGLLLETVSQGDEARLIVGLGLNVFESPSEVPAATSVLKNLPVGSPLLGDDWVGFLDRWLLELTTAVGRGSEKLDSSECLNLKHALNRRLKGDDAVTEVKDDGGLLTGRGARSWMEL